MSSSISHVSAAASHFERETGPIRAANEIEDDLAQRREQLHRNWICILYLHSAGAAHREHGRRLGLQRVQQYEEEIAELEEELYKSRYFERWVEDVAEREGCWFREGAWGDEGGERDLVWEEAGEAERKEEEMVESVGRRCRWDT